MPSPSEMSVIVCTRNRPERLHSALTAIRSATPGETEVIVVDSASDTDQTRSVALEHGAVYVRSGKGLSVARNAGITSSTRPLVVFTDDDCLPSPGWVDRLLPHFSDPGVGAVTGRMLDHTQAENPTPYTRRVLYRRPLEGLDAGHGAIMAFRRELLLRLGGFDEVMGAGQSLAGAEDLDIFVRVLRAGEQIVHDQKCVVLHANTRVGEEYVELHRGYGRGLGALIGKWFRVDPAFGALVGWRLLGRTVTRILRARRRGGDFNHDVAMFSGALAGIRAVRRLPVIGERFVPPWRTGAPTLIPEAEDPISHTQSRSENPDVSVELLRTLDEKHVATSLDYEAMHTGGVLVLDGAALNSDDGRIDTELVINAVERVVGRVPQLRSRLLSSPLGLTTPAWVPDAEFDVRRHLYFSDEPVAFDADRLRWLTTHDRGNLPRDRPLWDITLTRLDTGDIAMGARLHHASGDAKWAFDTLMDITDASATFVGDDPLLPAQRPPRSAWMIPWHASKAWLKDQDSIGGGWREYWRKPFIKRVKRMGGRNLRPFKEVVIRHRDLRSTYLPPTAHAFFTLDVSRTARRAAKMRGSLNDLLIAASIRSVDDDDRGVDVLVPVSRRTRGDRAVRNNISITRVHGEPGVPLAELVGSVRAHVAAFATGKDLTEPAQGRTIGYATVLPWAKERRWFAGAEVKELVVMPASDPRDEFSAFASVYGDQFTVTITTRAELDTARGASRLKSALVGEESTG